MNTVECLWVLNTGYDVLYHHDVMTVNMHTDIIHMYYMLVWMNYH